MPIHKEGSGYQWGSHGKVYPNRAGAERQAAAAYANGYEGKAEGGEVTREQPMKELNKNLIKQCLQAEMDGAKHDVLHSILSHGSDEPSAVVVEEGDEPIEEHEDEDPESREIAEAFMKLHKKK